MTVYTRRDFMRISMAGIAGAGIINTTAHSADTFTFAAINDPHIKDAASVALLAEAVTAINATPEVQFTCLLGDIATDGKADELTITKAALDKLVNPYFVVPGNHDVALRMPDIFANYKAAFGPVHWKHEAGGWTFIGFNSCEGVRSDVTVSSEELAWLQKCLKTIDPKQPLSLFCHHPLNPNTKAYRIQNADEILRLFSGHNLKIAAAGHWHGNQMEEQDGVLFVTTACCASTRGNFDKSPEKGFRLFNVQDGVVETEFVVVSA